MSTRLKISSSESSAVMFVDMVGSTRMSCQIPNLVKLAEFYETFINTLADIATEHGATMFKHGGDSIFCHFPKTVDVQDKSTFMEVLDCAFELINIHDELNKKLSNSGLPSVDYRVSADYGRHLIVKNQNSETVDVFGPTMCICSKINTLSPPNRMVIGSDLFQILKSFRDLDVRYLRDYKVDEKRPYPVFLVNRRCEVKAQVLMR